MLPQKNDFSGTWLIFQLANQFFWLKHFLGALIHFEINMKRPLFDTPFGIVEWTVITF
jgi:hypothetical protein